MQNTDLNLGFGLQAQKPNAKQSIFLGKPISTELSWKAGFKLLLHKSQKNQSHPTYLIHIHEIFLWIGCGYYELDWISSKYGYGYR